MDGWTDGRTDELIPVGLGNLIYVGYQTVKFPLLVVLLLAVPVRVTVLAQ